MKSFRAGGYLLSGYFNLLLAFMVIILAILAGRFVLKSFYKMISRISGKISIGSLFGTISQIIILLIGLFVALDIYYVKYRIKEKKLSLVLPLTVENFSSVT